MLCLKESIELLNCLVRKHTYTLFNSEGSHTSPEAHRGETLDNEKHEYQ